MRGRRRFALSLLLLGIAPLPAVAAEAPAGQAAAGDTATLDVRDTLPPLVPTARQREAAAALAGSLSGLRLAWNARFGTPATIIRWGAALTEPASGSHAAVARRWLADHAALFGWSAADGNRLRIVKVLRQPDGGPVAVLFHQRFGALEGGSLGGSILVALDRSNRILSVRAAAVRSPSIAGGARVGPSAALARVAGAARPRLRAQKGDWLAFEGRNYARRVAFPLGDAPARPAWEIIWARRLDEGYRVVVDAATGRIVFRHPRVRFDAPEGRVFRTYPGAPRGGVHEMASFAGEPLASPSGWLSTPGVDVPAATTVGNNAATATNWTLTDVPDGPGGLRPVEVDGVFDHPFTDAWAASQCGSNPVTAQTGTADTPVYAHDALAGVVNVFYHHNVAHDLWYRLGFVEEAGAMQTSNFGRTAREVEGDPLIGLVQAGAAGGDTPGAQFGRNNAYIFPTPDGIPPWSGMFLFEPVRLQFGVPCRDGAFDANLIYHEYAHGVTDRWVGAESGNLDTRQGGAMGEGWSDFFALHYLHRNRLETGHAIGPYVTGSAYRGIRNYPISAVAPGFGDIGYDIVGDDVHADGEIWAGTLWEIRTEFARLRKTDFAVQLIADAMPIAGPVPSMLDMRDAILAADFARTGGENLSELWKVFARRGMGASAFAVNADDVDPRPAWDHRDPDLNGRVVASVIDAATGGPVGHARVFLGHFEARVSPATLTSSAGELSVLVQAGRYPITVQAPGYGSHTLAFDAAARRLSRFRIALSPNLASPASGATIVEASNPSSFGPPGYAIDDNEATSWLSDEDDDGPTESFVVRLPRPADVQAVRLSAFPLPDVSRFTALRRWRLESSLDGVRFRKVAEAVFGTDRIRPLAPNLHYRTWRLAHPVRAAYLRLVAEPQDASVRRVQVAELQVFERSVPAVVRRS